MDKKRVWILDDEQLVHDKEIEVYEKHQVSYRLTTKVSFEKDYNEFGKYADAVVAQVGFQVNKQLIDSLAQCKIIATFGMGFNHVDLEAAKEKEIFVCNIPDYCKEEVADHTLALSLTLLRQLHTYDRRVKNGQWEPILPTPLHRLSSITVGLLGFGQIAQIVAKRFKAFGMKVIAHDKFVAENIFQQAGVDPVSLEQLFQRSHLLSLHVPLTKETENMVNYERMKLLPNKAIIVNTCRGGIIDESDLVKLIRSGHLLGAGLDVLTEEPPSPTNPLLSMDEVLISPHAAYYSKQAEEEMQIRTAENIISVFQNERPMHIVNGL